MSVQTSTYDLGNRTVHCERTTFGEARLTPSALTDTDFGAAYRIAYEQARHAMLREPVKGEARAVIKVTVMLTQDERTEEPTP